MATYDLDRTELNHLLTPNIDPARERPSSTISWRMEVSTTTMTIMTMVMATMMITISGHGHHDPDPTVKLEISDGTLALDPNAQVLDLTSATNTVTTDAAPQSDCRECRGRRRSHRPWR